MKSKGIISLVLIQLIFFVSYSQKTISEGTITYDILIQPKSAEKKDSSRLTGTKAIIYLKGSLCRTDISSSLGTETTIYNQKVGNAAILKEYSGQKLMITLTKENWDSRNKKFDGITFVNTGETKVINGYNCKFAVSKLKDGSTISVFYTPDLFSLNKEYNQAFRNLTGFPLEYQIETEKLIYKYQINKIDFSPVPSQKFDFPKSGYRIMTYDENKSGKSGD